MKPSLRLARYGAGKLAFAPDGITLAAESGLSVELWNIRTGKTRRIALPSGADGRLFALAFSPDGRRLATATADGVVRLWEVGTGRLIDAALSLRSTYWHSSPDLRMYVATDELKRPRAYATGTGRPIGAEMRGMSAISSESEISADNQMIARAAPNDAIRIFDLPTGKQISVSPGRMFAAGAIAFRPHHRQIAISNQVDQQVRLWNVDTNSYEGTAPIAGRGAAELAFSADGRLLAIAEDGNVGNSAAFQIIDVETRRPVGPSFTMGSTVMEIVFSPDGSLVGAVDFDDRARVWNRTSGNLVADIDDVHATTLAFSADGRYFATAGIDGRVRVWKVRDGKQLGAPINVGGYIGGVVFEPDGRTVTTLDHGPTASQTDTPHVRTWDLALAADPLGSLCGQVGAITAADSKRLVPGEDLSGVC